MNEVNIKRNVSEIRRLLTERKEGMQVLTRFLVSKGIKASIADAIALELSVEGKEITHAREKVMERIRVTGDLSFDRPHQLVFVGPTGVGKTTTLLKLAGHYHSQGRKVALASLDEEKKGGIEQWAKMRQIPFHHTLPSRPAELLLIDTEGCNFYQPNRVEALGDKLAAWGGEVVLVLSAAAKEVDLYGAVHQFSLLSPASLVFTKLDETLTSGVLVNVCAKTDLPIRYIAFGYPLPGDLQIADVKSITHKILTDFNKEEFHLLRQLSALN